MPLSVKSYKELDKDTVQAQTSTYIGFQSFKILWAIKYLKLFLKFTVVVMKCCHLIDLLNRLEKLGYIESAKE